MGDGFYKGKGRKKGTIICYYKSPGKEGGGVTKDLAVEVERVVGFEDTLEVEPSRIYWPFELCGRKRKG